MGHIRVEIHREETTVDVFDGSHKVAQFHIRFMDDPRKIFKGKVIERD
jgi:hypothetical protein